ncbi:MAG: DUF6318 family protein [Nocardioidaceae bacterium]
MRGSRAGASARRLASVAVVLLCAALSGCQSNPEPPPLEGAPTSASPSPSPTEAAPTLPAEAKGTSPASAKAFVRHYFNSLNYAMNSGDVDQFEVLATSGCQSCRAVAHNIDQTYSAGGEITSEGWLIQSVSLVPLQPRHRPILDLGVLMTKERVVATAGAPPKSFRGGKQPMTIHLVRANGGWRVERLDRVT